MTEWLPWTVLAIIPAVPLLMTFLNLLTWPRAKAVGKFEGPVSVLIPARNEESNIETCVRSVVSSSVSVEEVIVFDDQSTDRTPGILKALMREIPELRVLAGDGIPAGWVGKPHACHHLAQEASGEVLVFVDADVRLEREGLARIAAALSDNDLLCAFPRQQTLTLFERLIVPLLSLTYTSWFPLRLVRTSSNPRFVAANGQVMVIRRNAYQRVGGFAAVASEMVDDVALVRRAKQLGLRASFIDGDAIATCRMYRSRREIWQGFSKNLYEGIGESPVALGAIAALYCLAFVLPYIAAVSSWAWGPLELTRPAIVGVGSNLATRATLALRFRHSVSSVLLHPVAVVVLIAIAFNSYRWSRRGTLVWGGRTYARRAQRETS